MENNVCDLCRVQFQSKRKDAKYCSPRCRVTASRKDSVVTDNVTHKQPEQFEFHTKYRHTKSGIYENEDGLAEVRKATVWYDVPLGAVPILKEGWPEMPEYMNGRQYFLWWKNNFAIKNEKPEILSPYQEPAKQVYVKASEESRRWGAR